MAPRMPNHAHYQPGAHLWRCVACLPRHVEHLPLSLHAPIRCRRRRLGLGCRWLLCVGLCCAALGCSRLLAATRRRLLLLLRGSCRLVLIIRSRALNSTFQLVGRMGPRQATTVRAAGGRPRKNGRFMRQASSCTAHLVTATEPPTSSCTASKGGSWRTFFDAAAAAFLAPAALAAPVLSAALPASAGGQVATCKESCTWTAARFSSSLRPRTHMGGRRQWGAAASGLAQQHVAHCCYCPLPARSCALRLWAVQLPTPRQAATPAFALGLSAARG